MFTLVKTQTPEIARQLKGEWKVGDWCVQEYKIKQVQEMRDDGAVRRLSDGWFTSSYSDFREEMFPLTLETKTLCYSVESEYKKLNKYRGLNFPDIHRKYQEFFIEGCKMVFKVWKDKTECTSESEKFYERLSVFTGSIIDKVEGVGEVDGVRIFN